MNDDDQSNTHAEEVKRATHSARSVVAAAPSGSARDILVEIARDLERLAQTYLATARSHALDALDGNEIEARAAKLNLGKSEAYVHATRLVDTHRRAVERDQSKSRTLDLCHTCPPSMLTRQ